MRSKTEVSGAYTTEMLRRHGHKRTRPLREQEIIITSTGNAGSIGDTIADHLQELAYDVERWSQLDCDVTSQVQVQLSQLAADSLILCHGAMHLDWFEDTPKPELIDVIDVNLIGSALVAQEFVSQTLDLPFRKQIIFTGSMAYNHVLNGSAAYCASKAGVAMLARCLAWELAPKGYDVFCIHPSNTRGTPMEAETIHGLERYRGMSHAEAEGYWNTGMIRDEMLTPDDLAELVVFLLSGKAAYLSGAQLEMGGGLR